MNLGALRGRSTLNPKDFIPYEKREQIGAGTYGTVYKGIDKKNGTIVALKRVRVPLTQEGLPMNTLREVALLKQLDTHQHPNIVRLLDVCHGKRLDKEQLLVLYLVFEHADKDLATYMKEFPQGFGTVKIKEISRAILSGVDFLHSHRIVHRDLKPQNLLVTASGHVKLADFGLAKTYDFEMKLTSVVVTLWYRAPEVLLGLSYATPVDVWSVACIIAELYTFNPLFYGVSESDQLHQIFRILGKPPREEWPNESAYIKWNSFDVREHVGLKNAIPNLCENGFDLLSKMLTFVPSKRLNAFDALNHTYFTEEPLDT